MDKKPRKVYVSKDDNMGRMMLIQGERQTQKAMIKNFNFIPILRERVREKNQSKTDGRNS